MLLQEELQISHGAREKELNKQRAVDRARVRDPSNRQKIVSLFGILDWFLDVLGFPQLYSWSLSTTAYWMSWWIMISVDYTSLAGHISAVVV